MDIKDLEKELIDELCIALSKDGRKRLGQRQLLKPKVEFQEIYNMGYLTKKDTKRNIRTIDLSYRVVSDCDIRSYKAMIGIKRVSPSEQKLIRIKNVRQFGLC